jgi:hypothetical protein
MTAKYFIEIKNEEWYIKSIEHGACYDLYSHPCIPYIERLECEEDNDELFKFLKSVFLTHTLNVDQNNKDTMFRVAEEMYNKL